MSIDDLEHQFVRFLDEGHRLKQKYKSEITLFVGAETEYITELESTRLQSLLDHHRGRIEFLVGSIHHVNAIPIDFDDATFRRALESFSPDLSSEMSEDDSRISALLGSYLDSQYLLMQRFHPEIIGHLDLCRLYRAKLEFRTFPGALAKLQRNIEYACGYGALFELNAAAFRKGWDSAYPGRDVLQVSGQRVGHSTLPLQYIYGTNLTHSLSSSVAYRSLSDQVGNLRCPTIVTVPMQWASTTTGSTDTCKKSELRNFGTWRTTMRLVRDGDFNQPNSRRIGGRMNSGLRTSPRL